MSAVIIMWGCRHCYQLVPRVLHTYIICRGILIWLVGNQRLCNLGQQAARSRPN